MKTSVHTQENYLIDTSYSFALTAVRLHKKLGENQCLLSASLEKTATRLALHVQEARQGSTWNDSRLTSARENARESFCYLRLLYDSNQIGEPDYLTLETLLEQLTRQLRQAARNTPLFNGQ